MLEGRTSGAGSVAEDVNELLKEALAERGQAYEEWRLSRQAMFEAEARHCDAQARTGAAFEGRPPLFHASAEVPDPLASIKAEQLARFAQEGAAICHNVASERYCGARSRVSKLARVLQVLTEREHFIPLGRSLAAIEPTMTPDLSQVCVVQAEEATPVLRPDTKEPGA
jgi:hypothetical protein